MGIQSTVRNHGHDFTDGNSDRGESNLKMYDFAVIFTKSRPPPPVADASYLDDARWTFGLLVKVLGT
eukprot:2214149-Prymnesium_polylepis.1